MRNRALIVALSLVALALQGCGVQDPGQAAVGSISVKPKDDDHGFKVQKKATRSGPKKG
jgi:hypothetical protein